MNAAYYRPVALGCLLALVGSAGVADAARRKPKPPVVAPVCNLVSDPAPDANLLPAGTSNDPTVDITSADIATDGKTLTTVIRVGKAATTSTSSPTGVKYEFIFSVGSQQLFTSVTNDPANGTLGFSGYLDTSGGHTTPEKAVTIDTAKNEIRVSAPLADYAAKAVIKPGTKLEGLSATTGGGVFFPAGAGSFAPLSFDTDSGNKAYIAGTPSCVKVGS